MEQQKGKGAQPFNICGSSAICSGLGMECHLAMLAVRAKERKSALRACAFNQSKVEEASVVLIIIVDPEGVELNRERMLQSWMELGYIRDEKQKGTTKDMTIQLYKEEDSLTRKIFAVENASLLAMKLMDAARGLGSKHTRWTDLTGHVLRKSSGYQMKRSF